jgi:uncharacterized protein GlcG (DUF336 family)
MPYFESQVRAMPGRHCRRKDFRMTNLTLDSATAILARGREHAQRIGVPMNIAVTDGGGHLLAFARMDWSILGSIDIALKKAKTSILFNGPSEARPRRGIRPRLHSWL